MAMTMMLGVGAISSNTRGIRGQHPAASLLHEFHKHLAPLPDHVGPMLKSAESMLVGLASSHAGAPLADLVANIRPFIVQMQDSIVTAHSSAQQTLTNFGHDFSGCHTGRNVDSLLDAKTGLSSEHMSCRTQQKNANDQHTACESTLALMQSAADTSCQAHRDAMRTPGCGDIPANPGETWESYITRLAAWSASERDSFLHKRDVCNNDTARLEAQRPICRGPTGSGGNQREFEDKRQECDILQVRLEAATCSYVSTMHDTCEGFSNCMNALLDSFDGQLAGIQTLETQRKVEWNATERLLCLLEAYGTDGGVNASRLQTCQHIAENTSHLNLAYPAPTPRPTPCADLLPHPCTDDYLSEYDGLDAPAATCTPCSFPGQSGGRGGAATTPPPAATTPPGPALLFEDDAGCNGRATHPDVGSADLNFASTDSFVVEARVRAAAANQNTGLVSRGQSHLRGWSVFIHPGNNGASYLLLYLFHSNAVRLEVGTVETGRNAFTFAENQWYDIRVTYDGSETAAGVHIFVDGNQRATEVKNNNNQIEQHPNTYDIRSSGSLSVCGWWLGGNFNGEIQDVKIYRTQAPPPPPTTDVECPGINDDREVLQCHGLTGWHSSYSPVPGATRCIPVLAWTVGRGCQGWCQQRGYQCIQGQNKDGQNRCQLHPTADPDAPNNGCNLDHTTSICQCGRIP